MFLIHVAQIVPFYTPPLSSSGESITDGSDDEGIAEADDLKKDAYDLDKTEGHRTLETRSYKIAGVRGGRQDGTPKLLEH